MVGERVDVGEDEQAAAAVGLRREAIGPERQPERPRPLDAGVEHRVVTLIVAVAVAIADLVEELRAHHAVGELRVTGVVGELLEHR